MSIELLSLILNSLSLPLRHTHIEGHGGQDTSLQTFSPSLYTLELYPYQLHKNQLTMLTELNMNLINYS